MSTKQQRPDPATQALDDAEAEMDRVVAAGHASADGTRDVPDPPGDRKVTGEVVTSATVDGLDTARRNAGLID